MELQGHVPRLGSMFDFIFCKGFLIFYGTCYLKITRLKILTNNISLYNNFKFFCREQYKLVHIMEQLDITFLQKRNTYCKHINFDRT